jgi:hypothetical protein
MLALPSSQSRIAHIQEEPMAGKPKARPESASRTVTPERAIRLHRLLKLLATGSQTRASVKRLLRLDVRGFYRDLEVLREAGIAIQLENARYSFAGVLADAVASLPFPDPHLTLGEAQQLARGRTRAHRRLKEQVAAIVRK